MYEAVHATPDGDATASRFARTAAGHGYDGVVVRTRAAAFDAASIHETYGVDAVPCVEIDADDPGSAGGAVGNFRPEYPVVVVRGGTDAVNRFAVESDRVDVLSRPMSGSGGFNHVLAKAAADHDTHVEFDFGPVLRSTGGPRVRALSDLRKLREILEYYDAPFVVSANARSHLELRAPRELRAVGETVGFDADAIDEGLRAWGEIAERNRERLSEAFVEPGVRVDRSEEVRDG